MSWKNLFKRKKATKIENEEISNSRRPAKSVTEALKNIGEELEELDDFLEEIIKLLKLLTNIFKGFCNTLGWSSRV